jgi:hypothetical protein
VMPQVQSISRKQTPGLGETHGNASQHRALDISRFLPKNSFRDTKITGFGVL